MRLFKLCKHIKLWQLLCAFSNDYYRYIRIFENNLKLFGTLNI